MGELGFLGLSMPEEYGGQGGDYFCDDRARRGDGALELRRAGDGHRGAHRHGDAADPRSSAPRSRSSVARAGDQGREDPLPRHHRARRRLRRRRASRRAPCATATSGSSTARRRTSRTATAPTSSCWSPRPTRTRATTASRCSSSTWTRPGVIREKKLREARHARVGHGAAGVPGRPRARARVLGEVGKGFYHIMWELQGERLIGAAGCVAGAQSASTSTLAYAQGAQGLRPADRQLPGHPPQVRRDGDQDRGGAPARLHDGLALRERRVPGARDLDGQAVRRAGAPSRSPTSASRSTAAPAT